MLTTADGYEFTVGIPGWSQGAAEWQTQVTIRDGDKLFDLTVTTPKSVRKEAVAECVAKSMSQWEFVTRKPSKDKALRGGV